MADKPPSIDEIKRMNECIAKCGDQFLKLELIWVNYAQEKKISDKQFIKEMKQARKEHRECIDECVPEVRRFVDEQKDQFADISITYAAFGGLGVICGLGAAAVFQAPAAAFVPCVLGGAFFFFAAKSLKLWVDPIDPHFSKVPVPSFPKLPAIRPIRNTGLTASVAKAADAMIANQIEAIGLFRALLTTLDRSNGAAHAGDTSAEEQQLNAARTFARKLADVFRRAGPLRFALASQWTGPALDFTIPEQDVLKLRDDIIINGPPRQFVDALKKLGFDQKDRDALRQSLTIQLGNISGVHQIRFRDLLTDAKLRAAEIGLISAFEQFSRGGQGKQSRQR